MCEYLVARTGRQQQRYDSGFRLVAGCIPYRYRDLDGSGCDNSNKSVEVLMINSPSGPGLLFPKKFKQNSRYEWKPRVVVSNSGDAIICEVPSKIEVQGGWENDETVQEAAQREAIEEAGVRGKIVRFLGYYEFKSKTHQDEFSPEGWCRAAMFAMVVEEELGSWPEQSIRCRKWLSLSEAAGSCRHPWMRDALIAGFSNLAEETNPRVCDEAV